MPEPVLWMPHPTELRAGAVWITANNWLQACKRRYGNAHLATPKGWLDDQAMTAAQATHGTSRTGGAPSEARKLAETLVKDARWAFRDLRHRLKTHPAPPVKIGPFVWQHHDLFQTGGGRLARKHGVPLVTFVDAPWVWESAKWGVNRPGWGPLVEHVGERRELQRADLVLCVSAEVSSQLVRMGVEADRILVTPCTANPDDHVNVTHHRDHPELRDRFVIGWLGSFRGFHRLDFLVESVAEARKTHDDLTLLLVGDGAERQTILDLAHSLGVPTVAPGAIPHDDIPGWLATMDIATLPAEATDEFHYSPLKLKEYMASGRPIIAPRMGEMARVLKDQHDVALFEAGSRTEFLNQLLRLRKDVHLRNRLGTHAIKTVRRHFSVDRQLIEVEQRLSLGEPS